MNLRSSLGIEESMAKCPVYDHPNATDFNDMKVINTTSFDTKGAPVIKAQLRNITIDLNVQEYSDCVDELDAPINDARTCVLP
jgi:hypothetical protein